jgi:protein-disulfide isomerase
MTSGKAARRQRQEAVARPPVRSTQGRGASPKVLAGAAGVIVLIVVAVVLALVLTRGSSSSSSSTPTPLPDSDSAVAMMRGIPQHANVLGKPTAPVKMLEYIDLQCSSCRIFETETMPTIIKKYVRTGKLQVEARPIVAIGPDSERGQRAVIAAGRQNQFFTLAQILYDNQGPENGGWLSDQTVADGASGVPSLDQATFDRDFKSSPAASEAKAFNAQATADNVSGTPTVYVARGNGARTEVAPGLIPTVAQMSAAIEQRLAQ